jgi:hypothetical protein
MRYMIMAVEGPEDFGARQDPVRADEYWTAWQGYVVALAESGILRDAGGLEPPWTATTLRERGGERILHDGPYSETKEQLGGYFVIEAPDLDTALAWAARCPSLASGSVEVRPLLPPPGPS